LTYKIVKERTNRKDCQGDYILDGYPRTAVQAEQLEELASEQSKEIHAILVNVPLDDLEKRMTGRRSCPICGEIYNIYFKQPKADGFCDVHTDTSLLHRSDDTVEKVKVRLATYNEQTKPLLEYYEKSGRLQTIDGTGELEEIYKALDKLI
jgi:adenylate kinase